MSNKRNWQDEINDTNKQGPEINRQVNNQTKQKNAVVQLRETRKKRDKNAK